MNPTARYQRELATTIARLTPRDGDVPTAISGLFLSRNTTPTPPRPTALRPCFALVVQGARRLTLGAQHLDYGAGAYLVVSTELPVVSRTMKASAGAPLLGLGMTLQSQSIRELLNRIELPPAVATGGPRCVAVHAASEELLEATLRLLRLLERPGDIPALAPLLEQEILYRLLTGPEGAQLLRAMMIDSHSQRIARVLLWLRENYAQPLHMEELAGHAGMSVSSLHQHFKTATAMTPLQYQKQLRLHEARRLMLLEDLDAATAGYQVGYQSPSQFSREYRRLYSLSPRRDVEQLKREPAPARAGRSLPAR